MEKPKPQNGSEDFKFLPENDKGDLSEREIEQTKLYIAERKNNESAEDRPLTENDIEQLSSKYSKNKKETDDFANFIVEKFNLKKKINRRDFVKTAVGIAVGLTIGYTYFKENIDKLWLEFKEEKEMVKNHISLEDLVDNPELINNIDLKSSTASPLKIAADYYSEPIFHDGFMIKGMQNKKNYGIEFTGMYYGDTNKNREIHYKLRADMNNLGFNDNYQIDFTEFEKNIDKIAEVISTDVGISKETILNHLQETFKVNPENISVVKYENWEINKELSFKSILLDKNTEVEENYSRATSTEEKNKILEEFEKWGKENGYDDVYIAKTKEEYIFHPSLRDAIPEDNIQTIGGIKEFISEKQQEEENKEFENILMQKLKDSGYTVDKLKKIAEEDPKQIINVIASVIAENVEYDKEKYELQKNEKYDQLKRQTPYHTLKYGKGVCMDYAQLFCRIKDHLEKIGVPHLNKFISSLSSDGDPRFDHAWVNLTTVIKTVDKKDKLLITAIDPTWNDSPQKRLNAVDRDHYYLTKINKTNTKKEQKDKTEK